jgi:nitrate/TMAO reductase-like tetraheme cytochrome c subunit
MIMEEGRRSTEESDGWWSRLWNKPRRWFLLGVPIGGYLLFVFGVIFWTGFNMTLDYSNTETFCISCHEMRDNVYEEYKETIHYSNRTGVRAVCSDCHVPKEWFQKIGRKMRATIHELPHWAMGTIDTPEKFNERRLYLARRVWSDMMGSDSRECRNCHELGHMDLDKQELSASRKHTLKRQAERGETCIECHQGIAHTLPDGWEDEF